MVANVANSVRQSEQDEKRWQWLVVRNFGEQNFTCGSVEYYIDDVIRF